jgi:hypothetical protein
MSPIGIVLPCVNDVGEVDEQSRHTMGPKVGDGEGHP